MVEILLTPLMYGLSATVDGDDYSELVKHNWTVHRAKHTNYAVRSVGPRGRTVPVWMHRFLLGVDEPVDHIDGDGLNNHRSNIRTATTTQNAQNNRLRSDNKSGFKGVSWNSERCKWVAHISVNRRAVHLGMFSDLVEAALAYNYAAVKYFGEYARLNQV